MDVGAIEELISARLAAAGVRDGRLRFNQVRDLAEYIRLLTHWNRTTNLTSLSLEPLSVDAIDRLIVEPVVAAQLLSLKTATSSLPPGAEATLIDLGSGGGSPAIPMAIALGRPRLQMVESRLKKCAFLREASRHLSLDAEVLHERFEHLHREELNGAADVISFRAVRLDVPLVAVIEWLLSPSGRVVSFGSHLAPSDDGLPERWLIETAVTPFAVGTSVVRVLSVPRGTSA